MQIKLTFLGATKGVTGSRFLVETNKVRVLVDCGLFQERQFLARNWDKCPFAPESLDAVLLTHAHLDHCGFIPRTVKEGFRKKIYCTPATADIVKIMLLDTAKIQEQDAANKKKRHQRDGRIPPFPEIPLYTTADANACFPFLSPVPYLQSIEIGDGVEATFYNAGHVLGASMIEMKVKEDGEERIIIFSGDIGRFNRPILFDPTLFERADYVLTESTYGDRELPKTDGILKEFVDTLNNTLKAGGNVVIPSFALERAQDILYYLNQAINAGEIPPVNVYLDSPMAVSITEIFERHPELFDEEMKTFLRQKQSPFEFPGLKMISSMEESREIDSLEEPCIIIAGSGMCTGGRIKYHLISNITRPESTILFVGYQANETLGRAITDGAEEVRILGQMYPVKAKIVQIHGFSSHADKNQLLDWLYNLKNPPRHVFVVHGEEQAATHLAEAVREQKGWQVSVPDYQEAFILD